MIHLYHSGPQTTAVRFMMILSLATAIGACWGGYALFQSYGLSPADGGRLASFGVRATWGGVVAGLGLLFALGMWLYGKSYIRSIRYDPQAETLHLRTLGMFGDGRAVVPAGDVLGSTFSHGRLDNPVGVSVSAPWYKVRIANRGTYILDAQGAVLEPALLGRLLKA